MTDSNKLLNEGRFTLIELLMIIMLIGILFTLIIPLRNDYLYKNRMQEAIINIQIIARENVKFKESPENGYYAFDLSMLKISDKLEKNSNAPMFEYSLTDSTVVATSNRNFGREGAVIFYYLPSGPWQLGDTPATKNSLDANWLP
jgi:Tfp pilus assembly protein PilE